MSAWPFNLHAPVNDKFPDLNRISTSVALGLTTFIYYLQSIYANVNAHSNKRTYVTCVWQLFPFHATISVLIL